MRPTVIVWLVAGCSNTVEAPPEEHSGEVPSASAEVLARGTYLAFHVTICADCHSVRDWSKFSAPIDPATLGRGGDVFGHELGLPGTFPIRNITPAGIGTWSDEQVVTAFTTGITPNDTLFPMMPYQHYAHLCEDDTKAVLAWVRSLAPIEYATPPRTLDIPEEALASMVATRDPWPCPTPDRDPVQRGEYLVQVAVCEHCHSPQVEGKPGPRFAGGLKIPLPTGGTAMSANITPDVETGIGAWPKEAFIAKFRSRKDPVPVAPGEYQSMMPWSMYSGMTEEDLGAIYDYLRTVEPVHHEVVKFTPPS